MAKALQEEAHGKVAFLFSLQQPCEVERAATNTLEQFGTNEAIESILDYSFLQTEKTMFAVAFSLA